CRLLRCQRRRGSAAGAAQGAVQAGRAPRHASGPLRERVAGRPRHRRHRGTPSALAAALGAGPCTGIVRAGPGRRDSPAGRRLRAGAQVPAGAARHRRDRGDTVTHADLMDAVYSSDTGGLLREALLFDVYKPKQATPILGSNEKSLAVRLTLASSEATLTDEQIDVAVKAVVDRIAGRLGGRLR